MNRLHIDIETYSPVSLPECGLYKYTDHPDFRILLLAYAVDDDPVRIIDLARGEAIPDWMYKALEDPTVVKVAHNAAFERVCLSHYCLAAKGRFLHPEQWYCTMAQCARCGLPLSLADAGAALGFERQKMKEGKALIKMFCMPHKTDGLFGQEGPASPDAYPEQWQTFKDYCIRDVDVERQIDRATAWYAVTDMERKAYVNDQIINDTGVLIDGVLAKMATKMDTIHKAHLSEEAMAITGLGNPNSIAQLKAWVEERTGVTYDTFDKNVVADLMKTTDDPTLKRVLRIRAEMGKTSTKKYQTMLDWMCFDGRMHGITQYYGSRTGRWAGRGPQLQNLPRNSIEALGAARQMLREYDYTGIQLNFGNVPDTLSQLVRTTLIAPEGKTFAVCDFSAIEARVLAWLAGEDWVLDVFRKGGDIYCETASNMFHVPVEKHGRNAALRQKGKIAVLALGYQGAVGALDAMGGQRMGLSMEEEKEIVKKWRDANPSIVKLWADIETAARACIEAKATTYVKTKNVTLTFNLEENGTMTIGLPAGRQICYPDARIGMEGRIQFHGQTAASSWTWIDTFGGKLTENITQAVARDCLAEVLDRAIGSGFPVVFHVHDEIICEVDAGICAFELERIQQMFSLSPDWAADLPLKGAGYLTDYYKKD